MRCIRMIWRVSLHGSRRYLAFLFLLSVLTGFMLGSTLDTVARVRVNCAFWDSPAMADTVFVEYVSTGQLSLNGYGREWPETFAQFKALPGVVGRSALIPLFAQDYENGLGVQAIGVSKGLLSRMSPSLAKGGWEETAGAVPAVLNYPARSVYRIGQEITLTLSPMGGGVSFDLRVRVTGALRPVGAYPMWMAGVSSLSTAAFRNDLAWFPTQPALLLPLEAMPYTAELVCSVASPIALHLDAGVSPEEMTDVIESMSNTIAIPAKQQARRVAQSDGALATLGIGRLYALLFLGLLLFSVLSFLKASQDAHMPNWCVLHVLGMRWRMIAQAWALLTLLCCVVPLALGACLAAYMSSHGLVYAPQDWLPYAMIAAYASVILGTVAANSRRFARKDAVCLLGDSAL